MNSKRWAVVCIFVLMSFLVTAVPVEAQSEVPYKISIRRDFGYGSGADIQGRMSLHIQGDESQIGRVSFIMDGEVLAVAEAEPFSFAFSTDDFPAGIHHISASVETLDGKTWQTQTITSNFLTAEQAQKRTQGILVPILVVVAVAMGIGALTQVTGKHKQPAGSGPQNIIYGMWGGAVCVRCGKPFSRSALDMNLVTGRLERCPHCGKWQLTRRAATAELVLAEAAWARESAPAEQTAENETHTNDLVDDSRYTDKL